MVVLSAFVVGRGFPAASKFAGGVVVPGGLVSQSRIPSALTSSHGGVVGLSVC